jgi:hypothetical protein
VDLEDESEEDALLFDIVTSAIDADYEAFGLNDSMTKIDLTDGEGDEEEDEPAKPSKAAAKKAAAPAKKATKKATAATKKAAAPAESGPRVYTEDELGELTDAEVRAIGQSLGITTRGRDNWVAKILEKQGAAEDEPEPEDEDGAEGAKNVPAESLNGEVAGPSVIFINPSQGSIIVQPLTQEGLEALVKSLTG